MLSRSAFGKFYPLLKSNSRSTISAYIDFPTSWVEPFISSITNFDTQLYARVYFSLIENMVN